MPNHQCTNCNRVFGQKGHLNDHLKKKNKCQPPISQITTHMDNQYHKIPIIMSNTINEQIPIILTNDGNNINANEPSPVIKLNIPIPTNILNESINKINLNMSNPTNILNVLLPLNNMEDIVPTINLNVQEPINNLNNQNNLDKTIPECDIKCNYCKKSFARKNSLYRHVNLYCPVAKQQNKEKQEIFERLKLLEAQNKQLEAEIKHKDKEFKHEIKNLKKEIKNIKPVTNNTIIGDNNNNTTNIVMVSYGREDLSKITAKMLSTACKRGYNSVTQLIEMVHFNPIYPEFHNVYIPSVKDKHAMVYDENVWSLKNKDEVVSEMYDTNRDFILDNIESVDKLLNENERKSLQRWIDSDKNKGNSDKDKKAIDYTCEQLKLLLHNKRHIPLATKKQLLTINN